MKRILCVFVALALCVSFAACAKKEPQPLSTTQTTMASTTAAKAKEAVYNYTALEDILDKYSYDYIGGQMPFTALEGKLYFADHQYNTGCVNYYDFSTGNIQNLAVDNDNPLSGGPKLNSHSIVVASYPAGSDPLEIENEQKSIHVYDFKKGELFVSPTRFDFTVVAYQNGKVYGNDEQGNLCICNEDGSAMQRIPLKPMLSLESVYEIDGVLYACFINDADSALNTRKLVRFSGTEYETLADIASMPYFDGKLFYYFKSGGDGQTSTLKSYDVKTDSVKELLTLKGLVSYLYFMAGDRVYYPENLDDYHIRILFYDMKTSETKEVSTGMPAMGGW